MFGTDVLLGKTEKEDVAETDFGQTDFGHLYLTNFGQSDFGQTLAKKI